ncbi:MAG: LacI family transcriptional regulator [Proteobacteria bacterium]|nr:LacI family transcriptional regulator [Pseudomonadota bacterium]
MARTKGRLTQRDIAKLAGVSQAAVSLILNGGAEQARLSAETRERVMAVIQGTGYVADPLARQMHKKGNQLLGVFTYEPVFPNAQADFYTPFLLGIEEEAERLGYDLLLFTSTPVEDGRRKLFRKESRLRLADGCIVIGREQDRDELAKLAAGGYPFVAIGRRDDNSGEIPYVGADYLTVTRDLVRRAHELGHVHLLYVGDGTGAESLIDRWQGFSETVATLGLTGDRTAPMVEPSTIIERALASGATVLFCEVASDALALAREVDARRLGARLSVVAMGSAASLSLPSLRLSGFELPREEMGRQAVRTLSAIIENRSVERQILLRPNTVDGQTLGKREQ